MENERIAYALLPGMTKYLPIFPLILFLLTLGPTLGPVAAPLARADTIILNLSSVAEGGNDPFQGLLLEGSGNPNVGVILLHGRGFTPDGPVVGELRVSLNALGYTTLSIQEAIPAGGSSPFSNYEDDVNGPNYVFPETFARIRTAINELEARSVEQVVIIGHSLGSRFGNAYVARGQIDELPVIGLIGIGMQGNSIDPLNQTLTLDEVQVAVLDLFGDADDAPVLNNAAARLNAYLSLPTPGPSYTQIIGECDLANIPLDCINHTWDGFRGPGNPALEGYVASWMLEFAPVQTQSVPEPTSIVLMGFGLIVLIALWRKEWKSAPELMTKPASL